MWFTKCQSASIHATKTTQRCLPAGASVPLGEIVAEHIEHIGHPNRHEQRPIFGGTLLDSSCTLFHVGVVGNPA